jgi:hypothetical protein
MPSMSRMTFGGGSVGVSVLRPLNGDATPRKGDWTRATRSPMRLTAGEARSCRGLEVSSDKRPWGLDRGGGVKGKR